MDAPTALSLLVRHAGVFVVLVIVAIVAWNVWLSYLQTEFLRNIKWTILEIRPPKDVFKSPLAMELVLNSLYVGAQGGDWYTKYWKGEVSLWHSLEIASIEGKIHFYIRTPEKFKKIIQTQIYAQYPQAEVFEAEDYTAAVPSYTKDGPINLWGALLKLTKDDVYPIKTYVEYGLDRAIGSLDEEQRIDPITPMLEFFGSIGIGEQVWLQILIKPDTKRFSIKNKDGVLEGGKSWTDQVKQIIKDFNAGLIVKDAEGKTIESRRATRGEQQVIESIERNAGKYGFDSVIRMVYVAQKDNFNANNIGGVLGSMRQYNSPDMNGFKPEGTAKVDFPWQDMSGKKVAGMKSKILKGYKSRGYFYGGFSFDDIASYFTHPNKSGGKPYILSTEELATIYHLPGRVAETPTFTRIESKKGEPPANLPV